MLTYKKDGTKEEEKQDSALSVQGKVLEFGLPDLIFTVEVGKCEDVLFGE